MGTVCALVATVDRVWHAYQSVATTASIYCSITANCYHCDMIVHLFAA